MAAYKRARQVFSTSAMQEIIVGPEVYPGAQVQTDEEILDTIKLSFNTVYHAAATNKMGKKDDKMAVVDSKCRVYGVKRLRVVDASSFPFLPPGHPMSTICKCTILNVFLSWLVDRAQKTHNFLTRRYRCTSRENRG